MLVTVVARHCLLTYHRSPYSATDNARHALLPKVECTARQASRLGVYQHHTAPAKIMTAITYGLPFSPAPSPHHIRRIHLSLPGASQRQNCHIPQRK